jgi:hypothetical protein
MGGRRHHNPRMVTISKSLAARGLVLVAGLVVSTSACAWSNHALCTWPALSVLPEVTQAAPVKVESLESFLAAETRPLAALLAREEAWARAHVTAYPPRPDALAFTPEPAAPAELRRRFLAALRINPDSRLTLYAQVFPGRTLDGHAAMPEAEVTTLRRNSTTQSITFARLREGEAVPVLDVVATASDEPDHGLDVGLWDDSGTAAGKRYGFGRQPFGFNPKIEFASQGPFHVGFFHESPIVYKAAPFLLKTFPEYRIHLWQALAVHAMRSGHPYWAWRFTGWALHYIQDLTQPYHASVLPGVGVPTMLWINTLDLVGLHGAKNRAVSLVTNRHLAIENFQLHRVRNAWNVPDRTDTAWRALVDVAHDGATVYDDAAPRARITVEARAMADAVDDALARYLPRQYTSEPDYVFGETDPSVDLERVSRYLSPVAQVALNGALVGLLGNFGKHTRAYVRSFVAATK